MTIPTWDAPSYKCAHWETFGFDAKELSAQEQNTVELKATHRGPAYDLVLIGIDRNSAFVSIEDAERFASAILTVAAKARAWRDGRTPPKPESVPATLPVEWLPAFTRHSLWTKPGGDSSAGYYRVLELWEEDPVFGDDPRRFALVDFRGTPTKVILPQVCMVDAVPIDQCTKWEITEGKRTYSGWDVTLPAGDPPAWPERDHTPPKAPELGNPDPVEGALFTITQPH